MSVSIEWFGLSSLRIQTKIGNTEVVLVTDPPDSATGVKLPRNLAADIVVSAVDKTSANNIAAVGGAPFVIRGPGEYEIKNIFIYGLKNEDQHTAYMIEAEDMILMHLGNTKKVSSEVLERAENVDVLFLPVGGGEVMDAKAASAIAGEIQPRVIIPIHYAVKDSKIKLDGVEKFLKEMGAQKTEAVSKIKLSKKDLPQEETQVMVLTNE